MISIRRKLLMYLFGGMISATLLAGFATYVQVRHEMNEMFDYQLQQIATAFPTELSVGHTSVSYTHLTLPTSDLV